MTRMGNHFEVTLDEKADSFLGIHFERNPDGSTTLTQPKLLHKLFKEYPATDKVYAQNHPYGPTPPKDYEAQYKSAPATDYRAYLRLLGLLMYLTKSRPDIMAAVSFCATKAANPNTIDRQHLLYIVEYLRKTETRGHIIYASQDEQLQFHCTVDASYLLHPDSKGQTGYTIGLFTEGTFYNRSAKQQLVSTSSTHAEMRAIFITISYFSSLSVWTWSWISNSQPS